MELSYQDLVQMIHVQKCVDSDILLNGQLVLNLDFPVQKEIKLSSVSGDFEFRWVISQSSKISIKFTLHVMDRENNVGLVRLDYCPATKFHTNPRDVSDSVPKEIAQYAGLEIWGSHLHFPVPSVKGLIWAIPLTDVSGFPTSFDGNQSSLQSIVNSFANFINVSTGIVYESPVL